MKFVTRKGKNITGLTQMGWVVVVAALIVCAGGYNAGWFTGTPVQTAIDSVLDVETDITVGLNDVYFKVAVRESLGAYTAEDIICNAYDEAGVWQGTATASSGLATFSSFSVKEGSYIWLQARQAVVASADGYVTPLAEYRVGNGDPTDTVSAYQVDSGQSIIWVDNLHDSTEPVFTFRAPDGADLVSGTADNLTTGDTYFTMNIYIADDDCWYGAPDFTDMVSGDTYKGGIWILWKADTDTYSFEQGSAREMLVWSDMSYSYVAWNFDIRLWQDSARTGDVNTATFTFTLSDGADFDGGANTLALDVFDMMKVASYNAESNFEDGGALAPAAIAAYCD